MHAPHDSIYHLLQTKAKDRLQVRQNYNDLTCFLLDLSRIRHLHSISQWFILRFQLPTGRSGRCLLEYPHSGCTIEFL